LELQVVGIDAVGSEVVAGLFEEQPKRIIVTFENELEELGASVIVGTFDVFGQPTKRFSFKTKNLGVSATTIVASDGVNGASFPAGAIVFLRSWVRSRIRSSHLT